MPNVFSVGQVFVKLTHWSSTWPHESVTSSEGERSQLLFDQPIACVHTETFRPLETSQTFAEVCSFSDISPEKETSVISHISLREFQTVLRFSFCVIYIFILFQVPFSFPTWSSSSPAVFPCFSWRFLWVSTPAREESQAGGRSARCLKVKQHNMCSMRILKAFQCDTSSLFAL